MDKPLKMSSSDKPLVSIIIPTYNRARYLRQSIESALSQDYTNFELIVVDNGSTDNTPEILASFGNKIKCLKEEKRGTSASRNKGLRAAQGEFIAFLDDDDFYLPGKISISVKKMLEDRSVSLVYTDYIRVDSEGHQTKTIRNNHSQSEKFLWAFLKGFGILPSTTLLRKECLERSGYFDETLQYATDSDLWFRLLIAGYCFGHIPELLTAYRWHPGNHSHTDDNVNLDKIYSAAIKYFTVPELFGDLIKKKGWKKRVKKEYDKLADKNYFRNLPLSARAAAKKSLEIGHSRALFSPASLTNARQIFPVLYSIAETAVKLSLAIINPKLTRQSANSYREKINTLFFKLRYKLFKIFLPDAVIE
ncbi:MAG: glycosyltransferase [Candidatus Marinimicrobia bacterium]|nr:glycosyltransferase [Candidatus Neomarinimicrobiota bacterium]